MSGSLFPGYLLDANFIIGLGRRINPPKSRQAARDVVNSLIAQGLIKSPREVYLELTAKTTGAGDESLAWCNAHKDIFEDMTDGQQARLAEVLVKFPELVKHDIEGYDADPILVAMALELGWTVVSRDGAGSGDNVIRVHQVCAHYEIRCVTDHTFLKENGWTG